MSVYSLLIKILGKDEGASAALNKVSQSASGLEGAAKGLSSGFKLLAAGGAALVSSQAIQMISDLGRAGAEILRTQAAFDSASAAMGIDAQAIEDAMNKAAGGLVDDDQLIAEATKLMSAGVKVSAADMTTALELARVKAQQYGISTAEAFLSIAQSAEMGSARGLRSLGIFVDNADALENLGAATGRETDQVANAERAQAVWNAAMEEGRAQLQTFGPIQDDAAAKFEAMDVAIGEAKDQLALAFAPAVSTVAAAIADAIPKLMATTSQLSILARAGVEWAQAALSGESATAAFNASVADSIGATGEAARIRTEAAQAEYDAAMQIVQSLQAEIAAQKSYLATQEEGTMGYDLTVMAIQSYEAELAQAQSVADGWLAKLTVTKVATEDVAQATSGATAEALNYQAALQASTGASDALAMSVVNASSALSDSQVWFAAAADAARDYAAEISSALSSVMKDAANVDLSELSSGLAGGLGEIRGAVTSLSDALSPTQQRAMYDQYVAELEDYYRRVGEIIANGGQVSEFELEQGRLAILGRLDATVSGFKDAASQQKDAIDTMNRNYQSLRSAVESALQATTVTQADMDLSALGLYVDKWDENARRLDAIAQGGFAELQKHADWASILKIPPEVLAGSEAGLKAWADQTANAVRDLARPDLINIDAAADAVQKALQDKAAKEVTIDLVVKELQTRGVSEEAARQQVLDMYGLEEPLPVSLQLSEENKAAFIEAVGTVAVPVTLTAGEKAATGAGAAEKQAADLGASAAPIVTSLMVGINDALSQQNIVLAFTKRLQEDVKANTKPLYDAGILVWTAAEDGIVAGIKQGRYAEEFAFWLVPIIIQKIREWQQWEGNTD